MSDMERMGAREDRDERKAALKETSPSWNYPSYYGDIRDFHTKFELNYDGRPRELEDDMAKFRIGFMVEELAEYAEHTGFKHLAKALNDLHSHIKENNRWLTERFERRDLEKGLDSLIDLTYVALGTSHLHGFDFDEGWRRVHEANMKKIRVKNIDDSTRKSKYDVVKPKGWVAPDLSDLVE